MSFHKKLFWIDMVMVVLVGILFFVKPGKISDVLTGGVAVLFVISFSNHIRHYLSFKKFY